MSDTESAYRRGVHQALHSAGRWLAECSSLGEARDVIAAAERAAHGIRYEQPAQSRMLLDDITQDVMPSAAR